MMNNNALEKNTKFDIQNTGLIFVAVMGGILFLFENPVRTLITGTLQKFLIINADLILSMLLYIFVGCSTGLIFIIYWLAWDYRRLRMIYKVYVSKLVCQDYYKEIRSLQHEKFGQLQGDVNTLCKLNVERFESEYINSISRQREKPSDEKDDTSDGSHMAYYANGNMRKEYTYQGGRLEGFYKTYYPDGTLHQEKEYNAGKLDGTFKAYDENGVLFFEIEYKDDKQDGTDKIYYKNGAIQYWDIYKNGVRINRKTYNENGELMFEQDFHDE